MHGGCYLCAKDMLRCPHFAPPSSNKGTLEANICPWVCPLLKLHQGCFFELQGGFPMRV